MEEFRRDARNVKLRISDNFIEDVTDVLKRFFRELEDPVFTHELHPQWKEAASTSLLPCWACKQCSLGWGPSARPALGPPAPVMVRGLFSSLQRSPPSPSAWSGTRSSSIACLA